jgi:hypothetical protein
VERTQHVEGLEDHESEGALLYVSFFRRHCLSYGIPI